MKKPAQDKSQAAGRPKEVPDHAQMLAAARLYYDRELTRLEIAHELRIDTRKVTWLLKEARARGVVRINFLQTIESDLEGRILEKFPHLRKVMIVQTRPYPELARSYGVVAADYFEEIYKAHRGPTFRVAMAGGEGFLEVVNAIPEMTRPKLHVHVSALIGHGSLPKDFSHIDPLAIASILWSRSGRLAGHIEYATVSPYPMAGSEAKKVMTRQEREDALKAVRDEQALVDQNPAVKKVVERMNDLDAVFAGVGIVNPSKATSQMLKNRITMESYLNSIVTPKDLRGDGAIGDFSYCPFDKDGIQRPEWRFFLTAGHYDPKYWGIQFYKHMVETGKTVVAIGDQPDAVKAALKGQIFNVWITDQATASEIASGKV